MKSCSIYSNALKRVWVSKGPFQRYPHWVIRERRGNTRIRKKAHQKLKDCFDTQNSICLCSQVLSSKFSLNLGVKVSSSLGKKYALSIRWLTIHLTLRMANKWKSWKSKLVGLVKCTLPHDKVMNFQNLNILLYSHHTETNFNKSSGITNLEEDRVNTWNHHYQVSQD